MIVAKVMTKKPRYVRPQTSVNDVRELMAKEKIGKLPVLDDNDRLVGIITKKDLMQSSPSSGTTLDMYEISYLLAKLKAEKIMTKPVITVQETEVVEEAAKIMADKEIGCLPVLKGSLLVGIITESDLFRCFVEMFGARYGGVRVIFCLDEKPGQLAKFTEKVANASGNIVSIVTGDCEDSTRRQCTVKVSGILEEKMVEILKELDAEIEDIRLIQ